MRAWPLRPERLTLGAAALVVLAACSGGDEPRSIDALDRVRAVIGETTELCLLIAATSAQRTQGLQGVSQLPADVDGMVFVYPSPVTARFHMANTPIPLDIAFVAADGTVVDVTSMQPCASSPCPTYGTTTAYELAVETPAGLVDWAAVPTVSVGGDCPAENL